MVPSLVLVDGHMTPDFGCPARAIIGGDGESLSIAAASIIAKVTRDRLMERLAVRYQSRSLTSLLLSRDANWKEPGRKLVERSPSFESFVHSPGL